MSKRTLVLALVLTLSILLLTSFTYAQLNGTLQVSFIDVGQGYTIGREASATFLTRLGF